MIRTTPAILFCLLIQFSPPIHAHHGFAAHFYPDQIVRFEGTITRFDFINPHGYLFIESVDENGQAVEYMCDLQARTQLLRRGVDESLFPIGQEIVVEGFQARRNPLQCDFGVAYFPDGTSFTMRTLDGGQTQFAQNTETEDAKAGTQSIFGKWMRPGLYFAEVSGTSPISGIDSLTAEGKLASDAYDPATENPVYRCEAGSPIRTWGAPGLASEIFEQDGNIRIYHESMDLLRTVYMDKGDLPTNAPPSDLGLSYGYFKDGALVIETSNFRAGVLNFDLVHSEDMTLTERLSVNDDGRLEIAWTASDPRFYSELISSTQILQSTTQELIKYECVPEVH